MNARLKLALVNKIQQWLDENCDEIGGTIGAYQDLQSGQNKNAHLMADAAEAVIDAMGLQSELECSNS